MFATQSSSAVADYWTLFQYPKSIHRSRSLGSTNNRRQVPRDTPRRLVLATEIQVGPTRSRKLRSTSHVSHSQNKTNQSDRKSTRLNSSHLGISYAVFCLKKKN